jgi:uncharacterized protein YxeA
MKKLLIALLIVLLISGIVYAGSYVISRKMTDGFFISVLEIYGHEYIYVARASSGGLTHKVNCGYCR